MWFPSVRTLRLLEPSSSAASLLLPSNESRAGRILSLPATASPAPLQPTPKHLHPETSVGWDFPGSGSRTSLLPLSHKTPKASPDPDRGGTPSPRTTLGPAWAWRLSAPPVKSEAWEGPLAEVAHQASAQKRLSVNVMMMPCFPGETQP